MVYPNRKSGLSVPYRSMAAANDIRGKGAGTLSPASSQSATNTASTTV